MKDEKYEYVNRKSIITEPNPDVMVRDGSDYI